MARDASAPSRFGPRAKREGPVVLVVNDPTQTPHASAPSRLRLRRHARRRHEPNRKRSQMAPDAWAPSRLGPGAEREDAVILTINDPKHELQPHRVLDHLGRVAEPALGIGGCHPK